jgi:hypothetical protein
MFEGEVYSRMRKGHWVEETEQTTEKRQGPVTVTTVEYHDKIRGTITRKSATLDDLALEPISGSEERLTFLDEQVG